MTEEVLREARLAAGIASDDDTHDSTVTELILACSADLKSAGVPRPVESHPLYTQAVRFYIHAYGWTEPDAERWGKCYENLRAMMRHDTGGTYAGAR